MVNRVIIKEDDIEFIALAGLLALGVSRASKLAVL
jgi:hypothetical protein